MKLIERAEELISNNEVREASENILEDTINAVMGDPVSMGKLLIAIMNLPFFIRDQIFWSKMRAFLNGVYLTEEDCSKLRNRLTKDGEKQDNALRLVEIIDKTETMKKVQYLINASRCVLEEHIDRETYFRICHALTHTLEEDLDYLRQHINENQLTYCVSVQGLLTSGLMYQSVIGGDDEQKYSFTPLAKLVDQYAVDYDGTGPCQEPVDGLRHPNQNLQA